jgi:hypothetical protein
VVWDTEQAHLEAPELVVRASLDNIVWTYGGYRVESLVRRYFKMANGCFVDFCGSVDVEFLLVTHLLFVTPDRDRFFGSRMS